jgi:hypothetical protein
MCQLRGAALHTYSAGAQTPKGPHRNKTFTSFLFLSTHAVTGGNIPIWRLRKRKSD